MFNSFKDVNFGFMKWFINEATLGSTVYLPFTDYNNENFTALIRNGDMSSEDLSQKSKEQYPVITVTRSSPTLRPGFMYNEKPYYAALRDSDADGTLDLITLFPDPIPFIFSYEVAIATKNPMHHEILQQWLLKKCLHINHIKVNQVAVIPTQFGDEVVGDTLSFSFEHISDPIRSDGIAESIYEVRIYPYVYLKDTTDLTVIQELFVGLLS